VGLSVGVVYLLVFIGVTAVEYRSETAKLARGAFTDTFDALAFSRLLTFPTSVGLPPTPKGDLAALQESTWQLATYALGQAAVLAVIVGGLAWLERRLDQREPNAAANAD
jgi:hypothetical protein